MPLTADRPFNSWDAVKLIGLLLMFIDHLGIFFFPHQLWLRGIGRGAAPIFLFLAGYASHYRFKWDIFLLAVLVSLSDFLLTHQLRLQNILFSILLWHGMFYWLQKNGKTVKKPYEWFICCLAWVPLLAGSFEYGSFGLMFALCGYFKKNHYAKNTQRNFGLLSLVSYGAYYIYFTNFTAIDTLWMAASLSAVSAMLWQFSVHDVHIKPLWLRTAGKWASYYSGYIYAFHLIALEWLTGVPF